MGREADRVIREFNRKLQNEVKIIALDINEGLIDETPVDTGWARANWVPSIGTPFEGPVGDRDSFDTGEQEMGMAEVASQYQLSDGPVFITNNVPYIESLNQGHSAKAPAGFIEAIIDRVVEDANRRILK